MLFEDTYRTLESESKGLFKDKGSKFHSFAFPVKSENEAKSIIEKLKNEYYDARHHCYAYIIGYDKSSWRINDDGEPSGTAGKPIFNIIQSHDLTNCLIVVVRYFGGIKLGVSGLINAYKQATKDAIENSIIVERIIFEIYRIEFPYELINDVMKIMKDYGLQIIDMKIDNQTEIICKIRRNEAQKMIMKCKSLYRIQVIYINTE
jgi:uncharacterized YigZ family protein